MSIQNIRVNTDELKSDAAAVSDCIQRVAAEAGKLESAYHQLDSMWDGPTSEVFKSVYEHDLEALRAVIEILKKFNSFEMTAREKYDSCESEVSGIVSSLNW